MKLLITAAIAALIAVGCTSGTTDGLTFTPEGLVCFDGFSYVEVNGELVPSPSSIQGYEDFECPQN